MWQRSATSTSYFWNICGILLALIHITFNVVCFHKKNIEERKFLQLLSVFGAKTFTIIMIDFSIWGKWYRRLYSGEIASRTISIYQLFPIINHKVTPSETLNCNVARIHSIQQRAHNTFMFFANWLIILHLRLFGVVELGIFEQSWGDLIRIYKLIKLQVII